MLWVDRMRPEIARTLYQKTFFQFLPLALDQFPKAFPDSILKWREDPEFLTELERVVSDFSASPYNAESQSIHPAFAELLVSPFVAARKEGGQSWQYFIEHMRAIIVRGLLPLFETLEELSWDVRRAFYDWAALQKIEGAGALCEALISWSRDWNLDEDWCREYALAALCDWLTTENRFQHGNESILSLRDGISIVHQRNIWDYPSKDLGIKGFDFLKGFDFSWNGLNFQYHRWNYWLMHKDVWSRECEEGFRDSVTQFQAGGGVIPRRTIGMFRQARDKYLREVEREARAAGLVKPPQPRVDRHFVWLVEYQIPPRVPVPDLHKKYKLPIGTVASGIETARELIKLRHPTESFKGRKPGKGGTRKLSATEGSRKKARLGRFIAAYDRLGEYRSANRAKMAREIGVSENYFRSVWVPYLLGVSGCEDYESLIRPTTIRSLKNRHSELLRK